MAAPDIPDPIIATSVSAGSCAVEHIFPISSGGFCQYETVGFGWGSDTGMEIRSSIVFFRCLVNATG